MDKETKTEFLIATIFTHSVVAATLVAAAPIVAKRPLLYGAACFASMMPDLDVVAFALGIPYDHVLGHRGLSHSILFAAVMALIFAAPIKFLAGYGQRKALFLLFFITILSHGVLDSFTDGGHGIAFLAPFDESRYFAPVRPIEVSPIGMNFFGSRGWSVISNEFVLIWLPCIFVTSVAWLIRKKKTLHLKGSE